MAAICHYLEKIKKKVLKIWKKDIEDMKKGFRQQPKWINSPSFGGDTYKWLEYQLLLMLMVGTERWYLGTTSTFLQAN